ncbi:DUF1045 domain-containing protein [Pseudaestuariivita rosea]|uniref:DUF1045 domain-containing protein n=1 Tax=Pseudaestuariivita rosea TaxID=2763263 RepID=UPI001ABA1683|nr:DUF1045 domain-containing protein [Pseudaestuariivita rosea]
MNFKRYAVYYTPEQGDLADFGAAWLGWDIAQGQRVTQPPLASVDLSAITERPRPYGFHGTLKPPFRLALDKSFDELHQALLSIAPSLPTVRLNSLNLSFLGYFLALTPSRPSAELTILADRLVQELDDFRAMPSQAELDKRRKAGLSEKQEKLLMAWGYPYVLDEFRFHLTLTGPLGTDAIGQIKAKLEPLLKPVLPSPFEIKDVTLVGEDSAGFFHEIHRYTLGG